MQDGSALAALVIAVVALVVAAAQLTQQVMATAYVIRKCDRIVTGGLSKGGIRQWHWRQFRFTVKYQAIVFALPASIYSALGVSQTVQVDSLAQEVWQEAHKTRGSRKSSQGCWVSFVQDLVMFTCLRPNTRRPYGGANSSGRHHSHADMHRYGHASFQIFANYRRSRVIRRSWWRLIVYTSCFGMLPSLQPVCK